MGNPPERVRSGISARAVASINTSYHLESWGAAEEPQDVMSAKSDAPLNHALA
jgi:hypothetical protein